MLTPDLAIPSTLQDSLMARLDRLSSVKEVAQIGACIGREFSHALLATVSPLADNELNDALGQLIDAELIYRQDTGLTASYLFKHALVRDAAYQSLLRNRRKELHKPEFPISVSQYDFAAIQGAGQAKVSPCGASVFRCRALEARQ